MAGLMLANGNTNFGGRAFAAGFPFKTRGASSSRSCDMPSDKSAGGPGGSTASGLGMFGRTGAIFRAAVRVFRIAGRLFSGEVPGPVSRTPFPVDHQTRHDTKGGLGGGGAHSVVTWLSHLTMDHCIFSFSFSFISSGGWGKIKLKLTTLPRIFIRVVCRFNSVAQR